MAPQMTEAIKARISENMPDYADIYFGTSWCKDENDKYILSIYINRNDEPNSAIDPKSEEAKKIRKIMDKVFGKIVGGYDPFDPDGENTASEGDVGDAAMAGPGGMVNDEVAA